MFFYCKPSLLSRFSFFTFIDIIYRYVSWLKKITLLTLYFLILKNFLFKSKRLFLAFEALLFVYCLSILSQSFHFYSFDGSDDSALYIMQKNYTKFFEKKELLSLLERVSKNIII